MLVVVALIAIMIGVTFPAIGAGLESLRLRSAADDIVAAFNAAQARSDRFQEPVELILSPTHRTIDTRGVISNTSRHLELPDGIRIAAILPAPVPEGDDTNQPDRVFVHYPDGAVPRIAVNLVNSRGLHRLVTLDPITGVASEQVFTGQLDQTNANRLAGDDLQGVR